MKCIRCGFCCIEYDVVIVKPEFVDDFDHENFNEDQEHKLMFKGCGEKCPHLQINTDDHTTSCSVHNKPWFSGTPCDTHHVMGDADKPCRIGEYCFKIGWINKYIK